MAAQLDNPYGGHFRHTISIRSGTSRPWSAQGLVYRATTQAHIVAVKVGLRPNHQHNEALAAEAEMHARASADHHPSIVQFIGYEHAAPEPPLLVMEWMEMDLMSHIQSRNAG
jgi:serine/threonine protein kinase